MTSCLALLNRPFLRSKDSLFQNEAQCKPFFFGENELYLYENKKWLRHINGFALSLELKQRLGATRKCLLNC